MAAFVLFVVAVAGAVVADLAWENPTARQLTVFHHTVSGYPEGWLLAIAAGLGCVVALLLVASVESTKRRRARHKQLRRLRHGLEDQVAAPEPHHAHLLDAFFGPEQPSRLPDGPARPVELKSEDQERRVEAHQPVVTPQPIQQPTEPLDQQARSAHVREEGWEGRAEDDRRWVTGELVDYPPEPLYEQAKRAAGLGQDWGPPGRGQPGTPAVAVPFEIRGGKEQQVTRYRPRA